MNSVFHPSGRNPFRIPPQPAAYYLPSPVKDTRDKNITLTPQKIHRRHEYSIPPEVYTPEHYSFCDAPSAAKPPLPDSCADGVALNLQKYLDDVESWTSSQFFENWPSKETTLSTDLPREKREMPQSAKSANSKPQSHAEPVRLKTSFNSSDQSESKIAMRLNRFRYGQPKPPHERKSERTRLPLPSSTQKTQRRSSTPLSSKKSTSLDASKRATVEKDAKSGQHSGPAFGHRVTTSPLSLKIDKANIDSTLSSKDIDVSTDTSLISLDSRLEKILHQSSAVLSAQSPTPRPESSPGITSNTSSGFDRQVSSWDSDEYRSPIHATQSKDIRTSDFSPGLEKLHDCDLRNESRIDENTPPRKMFSPRKIPQEEDILYKWRLKRKLEAAHENAARDKDRPYHETASTCYRRQAEKPFVSESDPSRFGRGSITRTGSGNTTELKKDAACCCCAEKTKDAGAVKICNEEMRSPRTGCRITYSPTREKVSVGVGVVPMKSIETQTSKSLMFSDCDSSTADSKDDFKSDLSKHVRTVPTASSSGSSVSFHRVKIVQGQHDDSPVASKESSTKAPDLSPASTKTDATTIWSGTDRERNSTNALSYQKTYHLSPLSSVKSTQDDVESCSPTTNIVKEVVGMRLFSKDSPVSTSRVGKLRLKKKSRTKEKRDDISERLGSSYTSTVENIESEPREETETISCNSVEMPKSDFSITEHEESSKEESSTKPHKVTYMSSDQKHSHTEEEEQTEFDPSEMFGKLLDDIDNDPGDFSDDIVLQTLRAQRESLLDDFRLLEREIEATVEEDLHSTPSIS